MSNTTVQISDRTMSEADKAAFESGLKMGTAIGGVVGAFAALTVSVALPIVPFAVGTVVLTKKGWEVGCQQGCNTAYATLDKKMAAKYPR